MVSNYFVIGSLSNLKDKSNHGWEYVIFIVSRKICKRFILVEQLYSILHSY